MKTNHRETLKAVCRILSTVYYSDDFNDGQEAVKLANIRVALASLTAETYEEFTQMLGHDIPEKKRKEEKQE